MLKLIRLLHCKVNIFVQNIKCVNLIMCHSSFDIILMKYSLDILSSYILILMTCGGRVTSFVLCCCLHRPVYNVIHKDFKNMFIIIF
jgi:hypothetical protein